MNTVVPITSSVPAVRTDLHGGFLVLEAMLSLGRLTVLAGKVSTHDFSLTW